MFYRLCLVMGIYTRKIVGWATYEQETAELAAAAISETCLAAGITTQGLVLHSGNGSPMKRTTLLAILQRPGVVPASSRPAVSQR